MQSRTVGTKLVLVPRSFVINLMAAYNFPQRSGGWNEHWYNKAFVRNLQGIDGKFAAIGLSIRDVETELHSTIEEEDPGKRAIAFKKAYQRSMRSAIKGKRVCDAEGRMRYKLDRWNFDAFPRVCVREALNSLRHVGRSAPPRVGAAVLGTMWNRWATSRRIQTAGGAAQCKFGIVYSQAHRFMRRCTFRSDFDSAVIELVVYLINEKGYSRNACIKQLKKFCTRYRHKFGLQTGRKSLKYITEQVQQLSHK